MPIALRLPSTTADALVRLLRPTLKRYRQSNLARRLQICIGCTQISPASTKMAAPQGLLSVTLTRLGRSLRRLRRLTSKLSRILLKFGASGPRWRFVTSMFADQAFVDALTHLDRYRNYDEAIRVMQRAAAIPKNTKINYFDHVCVIVPVMVIDADRLSRPSLRKPGCSSPSNSGHSTSTSKNPSG